MHTFREQWKGILNVCTLGFSPIKFLGKYTVLVLVEQNVPKF
jgi:hypothetical protein